MLLKEIERKDFNGDKYENLKYLSDLFKSYQKYITLNNITSSLISHWQSYFCEGFNTYNITKTLACLHNHENYEQLKQSILLNFDYYEPKEYYIYM